MCAGGSTARDTMWREWDGFGAGSITLLDAERCLRKALETQGGKFGELLNARSSARVG